MKIMAQIIGVNHGLRRFRNEQQLETGVCPRFFAKGNPALKTLLAVLKFVGMRLSVEPENHVHA